MKFVWANYITQRIILGIKKDGRQNADPHSVFCSHTHSHARYYVIHGLHCCFMSSPTVALIQTCKPQAAAAVAATSRHWWCDLSKINVWSLTGGFISCLYFSAQSTKRTQLLSRLEWLFILCSPRFTASPSVYLHQKLSAQTEVLHCVVGLDVCSVLFWHYNLTPSLQEGKITVKVTETIYELVHKEMVRYNRRWL